jgi:two-component system, LytTR family, response regulator
MEKFVRCLIIDDEPLAQNVLENFIQRVSFLTLVAKCENALEAFSVVQDENIDIIFCDIQMPEVNGLDFVRSLKDPPIVVFTTAYSEYAVEGFNLDAADYLVKPVAFERFLKAVNKAKAALKDSKGRSTIDRGQHLFVKEDYKLVKINFPDIYYVQGMKDYVFIPQVK